MYDHGWTPSPQTAAREETPGAAPAVSAKAAPPAIAETTYYTITSPEDKVMAQCCVQMRHGVRWVNSLWVDGPHRRMKYGRSLLHAVIARWGNEDLYLAVASYTDRGFSDQDLTTWYGTFGFVSTLFPGGMFRAGDKKA